MYSENIITNYTEAHCWSNKMLGKNLETKSVKQEPKEEPTGTIHDILNDGSNSEELIILYVQHGIALVVVVEKAPQENHCKLKHH